jgi:hypothetical protein
MFDYNSAVDALLYNDDLAFHNSTMLVSHNAFASIEDGWIHHPMQEHDFINQFHYGARGFMVDVYKDNDELVLLHNYDVKRFAGIGSSLTKTFYFERFLKGIEFLLEKYEGSVITLIIENKGASQKEIKEALVATNLAKYLLLQNPNDIELNFGKIRKTNQRIIVFVENGDKSEEGIYTTKYYKETTYSLGRDDQCIDREENRASFQDKEVRVFVMNHFFSQSCASSSSQPISGSQIINFFALKQDCSSVNDYNKIMNRVNLCIENGNKPTFIAVDFIEQGNKGGALKVVSDLNDHNFYQEHIQQDSKQIMPYEYIIDTGALITITISGVISCLVAIPVFWYCYFKPYVLPYYEIRYVQGGNRANPWCFRLPTGGKVKSYE